MSARPDLSVIVVTHNRPELAVQTLRSAHRAAAGLHVQWLIVDSGSTDGTPERIERELPGFGVLRGENVGFAAANNRALPLAMGRYVLLLNPDVEIASGTFAELLAALDERPEVGVASVIQQGSDSELQHSIRHYPSPRSALGEALGLPWEGWREEARSEERYRRESPADWLVGAFLIARAEAVHEVGALDERFFLYSEETDWCYRAREAGWQIRHLPQMTITHHNTTSTRPDLVAQLSWAKVLFARKHYRRWSAATIRIALATRHLTRAVGLLLLGRPPRERIEAERHALAVVVGISSPPFAP